MGICCVPQGAQSSALRQPSGVDGEGDGREVQEGGDIYIPMADSCCYSTENNKIMWSNYPSIKK